MLYLKYALLRFFAMLKKEFIVIKRDALVYFFLVAIPFLEVILFGYVMNTDAKHLPTVIVLKDESTLTNSLINSFQKTGYFTINQITRDEGAAEKLLQSGKTQFVISIPENFTRDVIRGRQPHVLLEGDATDPMAVGNAFKVASLLPEKVFKQDLKGPLYQLSHKGSNFIIDSHAKYNPANVAQYHTLPGLLVTILTLSLIMITAISITSEYQNGTMEMILSTPIKRLELILGKIIPHVILGYILFFLTLLVSTWIFHVPFYGSIVLLSILVLPFIMCNLAIGLAVSSIAKSEFQAANFSNTYVLPATLLSGFMFPFYAMPIWAQKIGNLIPSTYFLRITSDVMLKGNGFRQAWPNLWPILLFLTIVIFFIYRFYRQTLD